MAAVADRARLTQSHWRAEDDPDVRATTIASALRAAAAAAPDTVALVAGAPDAQRRRSWTYAALLADAERAAIDLRARFVAGETVAVCATSPPESLVLTFAAAMARLVLVPLNPASTAPELLAALDAAGCAGLFVADEHRGVDLRTRAADLARQLPALRHVTTLSDWAAGWGKGPATDGDGDAGADGPAPEDVAQIVFTSGATGAPKGARLTHRGMTNAARFGGVRFEVRPGDVYVDTMPLFHVGGQVVALQICQSLATNVLVTAFEPGLVLELCESRGATHTVGVPTMLLAMIEHPDFGRRDLSSLRAVSSGGAVVPAELVRHIEATLGVESTICFGQTETCGFISQTLPGDAAEDKAATLGPPLPGIEARVVDEAGAVLACGVVGELHVRAANVMAGYHGRPAETAEAFTPDGWLRTGDLVTMDERGYLRIAGRRKDLIITGGENVYPAEVEAALTAHPDVAVAAVLGLPDRRWGEMVAAVVRPTPGAHPEPETLRAFVAERLAGYKTPKRIEVTDDLPLTASGKVQKFVLRQRLLSGAGAGAEAGAGAAPGEEGST